MVVGSRPLSCIDFTHVSTWEARSSTSGRCPKVTDLDARSIACRVPDTHT
jgi:hypothetical protein